MTCWSPPFFHSFIPLTGMGSHFISSNRNFPLYHNLFPSRCSRPLELSYKSFSVLSDHQFWHLCDSSRSAVMLLLYLSPAMITFRALGHLRLRNQVSYFPFQAITHWRTKANFSLASAVVLICCRLPWILHNLVFTETYAEWNHFITTHSFFSMHVHCCQHSALLFMCPLVLHSVLALALTFRTPTNVLHVMTSSVKLSSFEQSPNLAYMSILRNVVAKSEVIVFFWLCVMKTTHNTMLGQTKSSSLFPLAAIISKKQIHYSPYLHIPNST